jgi:hypothetical protein
MMSNHRKHVLVLSALSMAGTWQPASAAEFQCRHGEQMRRVAVHTGDAVEGAACEVRYWRNASAAGDGAVLWQASQDVDFCDDKARDLLARLEAGGWSCAASDPSGESGPAPEVTASAARSASPPAVVAPGDAAPEAPEPDEPEPAASAGVEPPATALEQTARASRAEADPSVPLEQPLSASVPEVEPSAAPYEPSAPAEAMVEPAASIERQRSDSGSAPGASAPAERLPSPMVARGQATAPVEGPAAAPANNPNAVILDRVVEQTLHSVQQMYGGDFRAEDAAFGDLDGDGRDDAAVLVTYQAERDDYVQYLVAYLFDGETFQSIATKNVGGRFLEALRADVRGIVDRAIVVDLQALDDSEVCCESRRAAFVLQEGQLVEVADPGGAPRDRS